MQTARLHYFERVDSTMDVLHALAEEGADAGTVVVAGEQLEGRGARGRVWRSPPGGLWLSILFRPPSVGGIEVISLRVGLAVAGALERAGAPSVRLKWPNDLMLHDRKLGGILCEARWQGGALGWVAVGLGLNISNPVPLELRTAAITLNEVCPNLDGAQVLDPIVSALRALDLRGDRLSPSELDHFAARSWLSGRQIREPLLGVVTGVSEDGTLRVRDASGSQVALRNASIELASSPSTL